MKRLVIALFAVIIFASSLPLAIAGAASLRVAPLEYRTTLKAGEKQKGVVDIANPDEKQPVDVTVSVQAFRQMNSNGDLEYFDDEKVASGIIPDLASFTLKPHETQRMYFLLDGTKLPSGNVFGVLMFTTKPSGNAAATAVVQNVRVGVLFSIVNGTPGDQQSEVTALDIPFWQLGGTVKGRYSIKNTGDPEKSAGFFPEATVSVSPLTQETKVTSPLVFPGIERTQNFQLETNRFGFYKISVSFAGSQQEKLVFVASWWHFIMLAVFVAAAIGGLVFWRQKRRPRVYRRHRR